MTTTILTAALRELASRYDMPEILTAPITAAADHHRLRCSVVPRGQMAGLVESLHVDISVADDSQYKGMAHLVMHMSYQHPMGGSNGYALHFALLYRETVGAPEYVGIVDYASYTAIRTLRKRVDE